MKSVIVILALLTAGCAVGINTPEPAADEPECTPQPNIAVHCKDSGPTEPPPVCHVIENTNVLGCAPLTCADMDDAGWHGVAGVCATGWHCCAVPWLNNTVWTEGCCDDAGRY